MYQFTFFTALLLLSSLAFAKNASKVAIGPSGGKHTNQQVAHEANKRNRLDHKIARLRSRLAKNRKATDPEKSTAKSDRKLAIASFLVGIFSIALPPLSIIGLILGIRAEKRLNLSGGRGKGYAIAGIIFSCVGLIFGSALLLALITRLS